MANEVAQALRHCVCGCGRQVPRRRFAQNMLALELMGELMEFDRVRYLMSGDAAQANLDGFIDDGVLAYESVLAVLHEEAPSPIRGTKRWLKFARISRKQLARNTGLVRPGKGPLMPREDEWSHLNKRTPQLSFSGAEDAQAKAASRKPKEAAVAELFGDAVPETDGRDSDEPALACPVCGMHFDDLVSYQQHHEAH